MSRIFFRNGHNYVEARPTSIISFMGLGSATFVKCSREVVGKAGKDRVSFDAKRAITVKAVKQYPTIKGSKTFIPAMEQGRKAAAFPTERITKNAVERDGQRLLREARKALGLAHLNA